MYYVENIKIIIVHIIMIFIKMKSIKIKTSACKLKEYYSVKPFIENIPNICMSYREDMQLFKAFINSSKCHKIIIFIENATFKFGGIC